VVVISSSSLQFLRKSGLLSLCSDQISRLSLSHRSLQFLFASVSTSNKQGREEREGRKGNYLKLSFLCLSFGDLSESCSAILSELSLDLIRPEEWSQRQRREEEGGKEGRYLASTSLSF
jgi:hypothetical protein